MQILHLLWIAQLPPLPPGAPPLSFFAANTSAIRAAIDAANLPFPPLRPPMLPQPQPPDPPSPSYPPPPLSPPSLPLSLPPPAPHPSNPPYPPLPPFEVDLELLLKSGQHYGLGGKAIAIRGISVSIGTTGGDEPATLDAQELSRIFSVSAGGRLTLQNVVLANGRVADQYGQAHGGGVLVEGDRSKLLMVDVHLSNNTVESPYTLFSGLGGAVAALSGASVHIRGGHFSNNRAPFGGALAVRGGVLHVDGTLFEGNRAGRAGCLGVQYAQAYVRQSKFVDGAALFFGGAVYSLCSHLEMSNTQLQRCRVTTQGVPNGGGGIAVYINQDLCSSVQLVLVDVIFDACTSAGFAGGLQVVSHGSDARAIISLLRTTFCACEAGVQGGGAFLFNAIVEMKEVGFASCRADVEGGGLVLFGGQDHRFHACNFTSCSSARCQIRCGGCVFMYGGSQAVFEDSRFVDCVTKGSGGAIATQTEASHSVTIRRCHFLRGQGSYGGCVAFNGHAVIENCHFSACTATYAAFIEAESPLEMTMVGGSVIGGRATGNPVISMGAVIQVHPGAIVNFRGVAFADCIADVRSAFVNWGGTLRIDSCNLQRLGALTSSADTSSVGDFGGAVSHSDGTTEITNTLIEGVTPGLSSPPAAGCLEVHSGSVTLRNVTLAQCEHPNLMTSPFLRLRERANFVGDFVSLEIACAHPSTQPVIEVFGSTSGEAIPVALRRLRISAPAGCQQGPTSSSLAPQTSIATCEQLARVADGRASCGASATCTDEPIADGWPTTATCSCTGSSFARSTVDATEEELPYTFGCFTQRAASTVSVVGVTTSSVIFRLLKTASASETQERTLAIAMRGTDTEMGASWQIDSSPVWLTMPTMTGNLLANETSTAFTVVCSSANQSGRPEPYVDALKLAVQSGEDTTFDVPVLLYVTAETVNAGWGSSSASCTSTTAQNVTAYANVLRRIRFAGCDRDGLKNSRRVPFSATASGFESEGVVVPVVYDDTAGEFEAQFLAPEPGEYTLQLFLAEQPVAQPLRVVAVGCLPGSYPDEGGGEIAPCKLCPHPLTSNGGSATCSICEKGYYLLDSRAGPDNIFRSPIEHCKACPSHADCSTPGGTTLESLGVPLGFWRASNLTIEIRKCGASDHCSGSGGAADPYRRLAASGSAGAEACGPGCDLGHTGPLCEWCVSDEQYFSRAKRGCVDCPTTGRFGILAGVVVTLAGTALLLYRTLVRTEACGRFGSRVEIVESQVGFQPKFKILVSFYQTAATLGPVYGVRLHEDFTRWTDFIDSLSLDLLSITYPDACIGSMRDRLLLAGLWPILAMLLGGVALACYALVEWVLSGRADSLRRELVRATLRRLLYWAILVVYLVLPSVSRSIFKAKQCESFNIDVFTDERRSYLVADLDVLCSPDDDEFRGLDAYFWAFFALWPVLVPLAFLALLLWIRPAVRAQRIGPLARACRFLWRDYEPAFLFWEVVDLSRKLFLASLVLFIQTDDGSSKLLRLVVSGVVSALYLAVLALVRPFKRADDLCLACTANMLLACCFISGTVIQLCGSAAYEDMCKTLVGFESARGASEFVIVLTVAMLIASLLVVLFKTVSAVRMPTIRLASSGRPPVLELPPECHFHGFISHAWGTGQDQTHTVVRRLQLLLPGVRIWLDVDNLEDVGRLEESVRDAMTFLVFLSAGYFKSFNCRRELYAALGSNRPFIPIFEADVAKGGASIEALQAECRENCVEAAPDAHPSYRGPDEMLARVFEEVKPIVWVRVTTFQLESLKAVARRMLLHSPYYASRPAELADGVLVPAGEAGPVAFSGPVTILVCSDNKGANDIARELKTAAGEGRGSAATNAEMFVIRDAEEALASATPLEGHVVLLLYLNDKVFQDPGGAVARLVQAAMDRRIAISLVHEQEPSCGGVPFRNFFQQTPQVLQQPPYNLYNTVAVPLFPSEEHRKVSLRLGLRSMGAVPCDAGPLRRWWQLLRRRMAVVRLVRQCPAEPRQEPQQMVQP